MRIWDVHPGYLNRQSLLGEHRELHGLVNIITHGKKGYSRHPETLRWQGFGWALKQRHALLAAEMALRGYQDKTPVLTRSGKDQWPTIFIDPPHQQFQLLQEKYQDKEPGRIPLPQNAQQLWSQHKYSILARDPNLYKKIGQEVARINPNSDLNPLALALTQALRKAPPHSRLFNALQHMWGYVSNMPEAKLVDINHWTSKKLLHEIQRRAMKNNQQYLLHSTALSELVLFTKQ